VSLPKVPDFTASTQKLIDALLEQELIKEDGRQSNGRMLYRVTDKGNAFSMTNLVQRMDRAKAEALLKDVLRRVAEINTDLELLHWVTEVRVFGSYLTDTNDLGDLDVAIKLERREFASMEKLHEARDELIKKDGKQFDTLHAEMFYPERLVWQRIKNRQPHISLHGTEELDKNPQMGGKTVYTFMPPQAEN
jgi:predicted nucleotidyltransferase